jgi:cytochrome c
MLPVPNSSMCIAAVLMVAVLAGLSRAEAPVRGKELFERRCGGCHSLDRDKEGPRLRGVYGRKTGSAPSFTYSTALKNSRLTWDAESLDKWLTDPEQFIPDSDMAFRLEKADERRDIIAYLKGLAEPSSK